MVPRLQHNAKNRQSRTSENVGQSMQSVDYENMKKAIAQAEQCQPIAERVPKVGAIIAVGDTVIGQGHRGTGNPGDDEHAEWHAIQGVQDRSQLPKATVYTTLEPCTPD